MANCSYSTDTAHVSPREPNTSMQDCSMALSSTRSLSVLRTMESQTAPRHLERQARALSPKSHSGTQHAEKDLRIVIPLRLRFAMEMLVYKKRSSASRKTRPDANQLTTKATFIHLYNLQNQSTFKSAPVDNSQHVHQDQARLWLPRQDDSL
ncbi:hypothetical protein BC567DRAFT_97851 [Phyllosticta citribraziliensis]